jgi:hypothetical protein
MNERVCRRVQVVRIGIPLALPSFSNLHDELSVFREFQNLVVLGPVATDPDELPVVDVDT